MANAYKGNPIVLDTFGANADIANLAFGSSKTSVHIHKVLFTEPTANDVVVLKDASGNIVAKIVAYATNQDVTVDFPKAFVCHGLQLLTADQTVTTGEVLIYV